MFHLRDICFKSCIFSDISHNIPLFALAGVETFLRYSENNLYIEWIKFVFTSLYYIKAATSQRHNGMFPAKLFNSNK